MMKNITTNIIANRRKIGLACNAGIRSGFQLPPGQTASGISGNPALPCWIDAFHSDNPIRLDRLSAGRTIRPILSAQTANFPTETSILPNRTDALRTENAIRLGQSETFRRIYNAISHKIAGFHYDTIFSSIFLKPTSPASSQFRKICINHEI